MASKDLTQMTADEKLDYIINKLAVMENKMDTLQKKVNENCKKLSSIEVQVNENTGQIIEVNKRIDELPTADDYDELKELIEDQANRLRRNNIVLHNVSEGLEGDDCRSFVKNFIVNHMQVAVESAWEIDRAHRSPTGPPRRGRIRPIHVRFLRYQARVAVLKAAPKALKDNPYSGEGLSSCNVFISDDVTMQVRRDRKKLVALKKQVIERWPGKKCFIPHVVPAILLREDEEGRLIRMKPGDTLPALEQ